MTKVKVCINQFNVQSGLVDKFRTLMHNSSIWHKIQVENAQDLDRDFVLKTLMNAVQPLDFIPVSYEVCPEYASFLLKNCGAALDTFCRHNLIIPNPNNLNKPFILTIELSFAMATDLKINVQSNVVNVLQKRLSSDGVLNLEHFYKDPGLNEFCPLSQPKLMFYILHLSRNYNVKVLKLGYNEIKVLKPLEAIYGVKSVVILDLRNNDISNTNELIALRSLSITELWLDGNPVCGEYDEFTYGRALQEITSSLLKLDGVTLMRKGGFLPFRRNFVCNIDGQELVDQFLEHYFTLYDSPNRSSLSGIYHKHAMFSLTSRYLAFQSTSQNVKLATYSQFSRNIKQISDFAKNDICLFKGPQSILKILNSLPRSEHDPYTFTVDLMTYTDTTAVIVVTGVFQELPEAGSVIGRLFGFVRTFVLLAGKNNEYTIVNEQLHVANATTSQALKAFKIIRPPRPHYIQIPAPKNEKDRRELIEAMRVITGLSLEWSRNCLEDAQYNLKNALTTFVELYKVDKIPQSAFDRESEVSQQKPTLQAELQKIQESLLTTKETQKGLSENKSKQASASPISEELSKKLQPETNITQKAEEVDDIFEMSYMNDDGISSISDTSESVQKEKKSSPVIQKKTPKDPRNPDSEERDAEPIHEKNDNTYKVPLPGSLDKVKKLEFKNKILKFKTLLALDDYKNADLFLEGLAKDYGSEVYIWRKILSFCFKQDVKSARHFVTTVKTANSHCISSVVFNSIVAEQECRYGNEDVGRESFEKLIRQHPERVLHHFIPYLHYLCDVKNFDQAKIFLNKNMDRVDHKNNRTTLKREVKIMEQIYNCKLL